MNNLKKILEFLINKDNYMLEALLDRPISIPISKGGRLSIQGISGLHRFGISFYVKVESEFLTDNWRSFEEQGGWAATVYFRGPNSFKLVKNERA